MSPQVARPEVNPRFPTVVHMLARTVQAFPDKEAIAFQGRSLTYREYGRCIASFARELSDAGAKSQRVAVLLPNSSDLAISIFAILMAGAQAVLLNPAYTVRELGMILDDAEPVVVLYAESATEEQKAFFQTIGRAKVRQIKLGELEGWAFNDVPFPSPIVGQGDPCILQYTGGTTGRPKGVNLSHSAISTNVWQRQELVPAIQGRDRILCCMPLFHAFATSMCLFLASYSGGCLVVMERYKPDLVLDTLENQKITIFPAGPTIFSGLLAHSGFENRNFSALRFCCSGSAPLSEETLRRWELATSAPIYEGYGMTETSPVLSFNPVGGIRKPGSVGVALPLTDVQVVDVESGTRIASVGERGEVRVRGPQLMTHYRNLQAETLEVMRDGWLYTGDIGELDEDGYLFLRDRKKDMAIVGGFNVFPREVEEVLYLYSDVAEAAVIAVPDPFYGESIRAFVVANHNASIEVEALRNHCAANLTKYKIPADISIVAELPKTSVGKIDKLELKRRIVA